MFFAALVVVIAHGRHITPAPGERSRGAPNVAAQQFSPGIQTDVFP